MKTGIPGNRGKKFENRAGLDALPLQWLAEDFAPLDELARNLASRVLRYVLDDTGGKVLTQLTALRLAGQSLRLYGSTPSASASSVEGESPRRRFFQSVQCSAPSFFVRLGRVYEAASRPLRFRMNRDFGDPDLDWLQLLLVEATQLTLDTWPRRCRPCAVLTADLIEAMLKAERHPPDLLVRAAFQPARPARRLFGPELEPVWEILPGLGGSVARHPEAVLAALSQSDFRQRLRALDLMKKCQAPPAAFLGKLFELALGPGRRIRARAEALLAEAPPEARLFLREKATRGGSRERARAARILWRVEEGSARSFLALRVLEEKSRKKKSRKVVRVLQELLPPLPPEPCPDETVEQPGVPLQQFLDRACLLEESIRGLAKGLPESLSWFPFQRLPQVHWADNGRLVELEIVRWWLVECCRRESPEPGLLLRQYASGLQSSGREALGRFVLESWISEDTRRPKNSAIASKGILALVGACATESAVPLVHRCLEEWYGRRAAQCRALLQMLAWVEHPSAAQLLLAVASGFRTMSLQEEASRQADYLAERKRCTVAELKLVLARG